MVVSVIQKPQLRSAKLNQKGWIGRVEYKQFTKLIVFECIPLECIILNSSLDFLRDTPNQPISWPQLEPIGVHFAV